MDKLKQYIVFTVLGCLVVLAAGWFLLVSPKRADAAALRAQAASQVDANARLENQLAMLRAQAKDLPKEQAKLASVAAKIPDNPALPGLIRALTTAGTSAGVELVSMTPGAPAAVAAGTAGTAASGASGAVPATAGVTRATASSAAGGQLAQIPVSVNIVGGYFQVEQFVAALENLPRAMRVTNITVAPGASPVNPAKSSASVDDGRSLTTTVGALVYMAANRPPAAPVVVPGQPAAAATGPTVPVTSAKK